EFNDIMRFAREISPTLSKSPSSVGGKYLNDKAFELLGEHSHIYTYQGKLELGEGEKRIFIDRNNYEYFARIFEKYGINPGRFLTFITAVYEKNQEIVINNDGRIINLNTGEFFIDLDNKDKQSKLTGTEFGYEPINNFRDKSLLENTRVTANEINRVLKSIDRLEPVKDRREKGRYFTQDHISDEISDIVRKIDPDYILEPFVGSGSLINPIIDEYIGAANDIVEGYVDTLKKKYEGSDWKFTSMNTVTTPYKTLFKEWEIPIGENVMILTNPPFGSSRRDSRNSSEFEKGQEEVMKIQYGGLEDKYGRGDLVLPAIAKCIEIIKRVGKGYIATFSPAGVMLNRYRYRKVFGALLKNFKFIKGHIFSGENFNSVSSKKAIAFTIWKYEKNYNQKPIDITYWVYDKEYQLRKLPLLKEGWDYDNRKKIKGEIVVQHNETFNSAPPKIFHIQVEKGGSELIQENVKEKVNIPNIPNPLIYGLWSVSVGYRSITDYPLSFGDCYTHLPDFSKTETKEILTYALIHSLITELKNNYCKGKIGFVGGKRIFKFGSNTLTKGAKFLIDTYGYCTVGDKTIEKVFKELKKEPDIEKIEGINTYRSLIKKEIEKIIKKIGYWDYLPISDIKKPKEKGIAKIKGLGEKTKTFLKREGYDSILKIAKASTKELSQIKGIGEKTAEKFIKRANKLKIEDISYFTKKINKK
ncbi:MAG: helix-hairpin-helix domain-containing protein, partial [Nanoarchaeota archaeon]